MYLRAKSSKAKYILWNHLWAIDEYLECPNFHIKLEFPTEVFENEFSIPDDKSLS